MVRENSLLVLAETLAFLRKEPIVLLKQSGLQRATGGIRCINRNSSTRAARGKL